MSHNPHHPNYQLEPLESRILLSSSAGGLGEDLWGIPQLVEQRPCLEAPLEIARPWTGQTRSAPSKPHIQAKNVGRSEIQGVIWKDATASPLDFNAIEMVRAGDSNLQVSSYAAPAMTDWNEDGLADLVIGEKVGTVGKIRVYLNSGTPTAPRYTNFFYIQSNRQDLTLPAEGCLGAFPRLADWNQDGAKDLLVGLANGTLQVFLNTNTNADPQFSGGAPVQVGLPGAKVNIQIGARTTLKTVDWNNDGKSDLVLGALDGKVRLFLNEASNGPPDFRAMLFVKDGASDLLVPSGRCSVEVADLNGDGRKDLLAGNTDGQLYLYLNNGTDAEPKFQGSQKVQAKGAEINLGTSRSRPFVCDFNGDGRLDLLVGGADGLVRLYLHQQSALPPRPPIARGFDLASERWQSGSAWPATNLPNGGFGICANEWPVH